MSKVWRYFVIFGNVQSASFSSCEEIFQRRILRFDEKTSVLFGRELTFNRQITFSFHRTDLNPHPASDSYMDYVYYHWSKQPFIRGGYSSPTVHAHGLRDELARPVEDCLFFAGEATSVTACATVHTAMETGFRAAREVCSLAKRVHTK